VLFVGYFLGGVSVLFVHIGIYFLHRSIDIYIISFTTKTVIHLDKHIRRLTANSIRLKRMQY